MAEVNKLIDKILVESEKEAEKILNKAKEKAKTIEKFSIEEAEKKYKLLIEKGKKESFQLKDKLKSTAKLKARDSELEAKQKVIKKVFADVLEEMKNIDDEAYILYLKKNITSSDKKELIVMRNKLDLAKENFKNIKISETRFVETGFIEIAGGVEKNFTFSSQIDYIKDEIQGEVAKILF